MFIHISAFQYVYMNTPFRNFINNLKGATAIEYGLIAGGIALVIMVAIFAVGSSLGSLFTFMDTKMTSAATRVK